MKNFASVSKQLFIRNYNKKPIGYFKILNEIPKEDTNYILGKGPDREERLQKLNHVLTSFVTGTQLKNTELIEENSSLKDDIINLKNVSLSYREDYARQTDKLREAENRYQKSDEQLKVFKLLFDDMAQHLLRTNELYLKVTNNFNIQGAFNHIIKYFIVSSSISEKEALKEIIQQDELLKQAIYFIYEHYQSQKKFFQLDYDKLWEKSKFIAKFNFSSSIKS